MHKRPSSDSLFWSRSRATSGARASRWSPDESCTTTWRADRENGIAVFHTPDYATEEVATHAVALILALNRRLVAGDAVARRDWRGWAQLKPVKPLSELTVGIVGLGRIGRAVAERVRCFA